MNSVEVEEIQKFTHVQVVEIEPTLLAKETACVLYTSHV